MRGAAALAATAALVMIGGAAAAHPLAPALLELVETQPGRFEVVWKTPLQRPVGSDVRPELPAHCAAGDPGEESRDDTSATLRQALDCGDRGLDGSRVAVRGLETSGTNALVRIALLDGRRFQAVLHASAPELLVRARQTALDVMADYGLLGFDHIIGGLDHLAFVFGLVLLVAGARRLLYTVTAFTAGHSVTLSLAVLGYVSFPSALVEIVIAGTILALALELARPASPRAGWMRRAPWAMAGSFGLLHGLGFAGALSEVGLPPEEIPAALFSFNVGIEVGQVAFVLVVVAARSALSAVIASAPAWAVRVPIHAIGGLAVYWCLDRASGLLGG